MTIKKFQNTHWQQFNTANNTSDFSVRIKPKRLRITTSTEGGELLTACKDWLHSEPNRQT
jgi:hypothetical protein